MFAYCNNDSVNCYDPNGYAAWGTNITAIEDGRSCLFPGSAEYIHMINKRKNAIKKNLLDALSAMCNPMPNGGTVSIGATGSVIYDGSGAAKSLVISADSACNFAVQSSDTLSTSTGLGASAGGIITLTNAQYTSDLNGASDSYGITVVKGNGISIDLIRFIPASQPDTTKWGISVAYLWGAGADAHIGYSSTKTIVEWNPISYVIDLITGG